jgi:hypothetical protein
MQVVDAPDAENDCRSCDILCAAMAVFRGTAAGHGHIAAHHARELAGNGWPSAQV